MGLVTRIGKAALFWVVALALSAAAVQQAVGAGAFWASLVGSAIGVAVFVQFTHRLVYGRFIPIRRFSPIAPAEPDAE